jgi:hypothetical protein
MSYLRKILLPERKNVKFNPKRRNIAEEKLAKNRTIKLAK